MDAGAIEVRLHGAIARGVEHASRPATSVESRADEFDGDVEERGPQRTGIGAGGLDRVVDLVERERADLELPTGLDGQATVARKRAVEGAQHRREGVETDPCRGVGGGEGEPFQLEPDSGRPGGLMDGQITDELKGVARGQAPRGRRHVRIIGGRTVPLPK